MAYLTEIAEAEKKAADTVQNAKDTAVRSLDDAHRKERERIAIREAELKEKQDAELTKQKKSLTTLYKSLSDDGLKEAQGLKTSSLGKRDRAIAKLMSFLASS